MKRMTPALVALCLFASPLSAQTMTVLLPSISFPDGTLTPSTKGCDASETLTAVCQIQE